MLATQKIIKAISSLQNALHNIEHGELNVALQDLHHGRLNAEKALHLLAAEINEKKGGE